MRYLFAFIILSQTTFCFSQFNVGESKSEVITMLEQNEVEYTQRKLTDSTSRISVLNENEYQMLWILNSKDTVYQQTLIPEMKNGVNEYVKLFNKDFVVVSESEWRNYANGKIYKIKLEYIMKEAFFTITLSPESN